MIGNDVILGDRVDIRHPDLVNLYGCRVGSDTRIGPFVEIQAGVSIGRSCKISSHCFICTGVTISDGVFVGHGVVFVNDNRPRATNEDGELLSEGEWTLVETKVGERASIGSNATVLGGVTVGRHALVGAGAVVTHDVAPFTIVAGSPARVIGNVRGNPEPS